MVRELNFEHKKTRSLYGNRRHTSEYAKKFSKLAYITGASIARNMVRQAVKNGKLKNLKTNKIPCVHCGYRATIYEHRDYNFPLDVLPSCKSCNFYLGEAIHIKRK